MGGLKYRVKKVSMKLNTGDVDGYKVQLVSLPVIKEKQLMERITKSSNVPESMIKACTMAMAEAINYFVINGHRVEFDSFGDFHLKVGSTCVDTPEECVAETVVETQLCFTPSTAIKEMLNKTPLIKDKTLSAK